MNKALEEIKTLRGFNKVELDNDKYINKSLDIIEYILRKQERENARFIEILSILEQSPFILQRIFEYKGLKNQDEYDEKYFWGTITEENQKKVEKWLENAKY